LLFIQLALYSKLQLSLLDVLGAIFPLYAIATSPGIAIQAFLHWFGIY